MESEVPSQPQVEVSPKPPRPAKWQLVRRYLVEFLVLVTGISVSLWGENWRESRLAQEQRLERVHALSKDLESMQLLLHGDLDATQKMLFLMTHPDSLRAKTPTEQRAYLYEWWYSGQATARRMMNAYESLEASELMLIFPDSLSTSLRQVFRDMIFLEDSYRITAAEINQLIIHSKMSACFSNLLSSTGSDPIGQFQLDVECLIRAFQFAATEDRSTFVHRRLEVELWMVRNRLARLQACRDLLKRYQATL